MPNHPKHKRKFTRELSTEELLLEAQAVRKASEMLTERMKKLTEQIARRAAGKK